MFEFYVFVSYRRPKTKMTSKAVLRAIKKTKITLSNAIKEGPVATNCNFSLDREGSTYYMGSRDQIVSFNLKTRGSQLIKGKFGCKRLLTQICSADVSVGTISLFALELTLNLQFLEKTARGLPSPKMSRSSRTIGLECIVDCNLTLSNIQFQQEHSLGWRQVIFD